MSSCSSGFSRSEIESRIGSLRRRLNEQGIDGALLFSATELYYYSGIGLEGAVYVPADGTPIHLVKRNVALARLHSAIPTVRDFGRQSKFFETLGIKSETRIAIEADLLPFSFVSFLQSKAGGTQLVDGSLIFRQQRSVKSESEIELIEKAASIVDRSFDYCTRIAEPNMTEVELASRLDCWLLENGHGGFITTRAFGSIMPQYSYVVSSTASALNSYFTPVSSGGLSLKYPYGPSHQRIGRSSPFLVDTCGNCQGYISDTTRTFVLGRFDPETRSQIDSLNQIRLLIQQELRPGVNLGSLYGRVLALSTELGIQEHFMGDGSDKVAFVGHGVGLELDDLPVFYSEGPDLVSGNVLACEPKLVFLGKKLLGIEDTFAVTETGCRRLSRARDSYEI